MFRLFLISVLSWLVVNTSTAQQVLPVPPDSKERIFYLQRDPNSNTIIYDMNYLPGGKLDMDNPVHVYWIKYAKEGQQKELLGIEKKYAYGVTTELTDSVKKVFRMNLVSYKGIDITLKPANSKTGKKYHALVTVNDKTMIINKIFLKINGGSAFKPDVAYIEFTGKDVKTGKLLVEKVKPEK